MLNRKTVLDDNAKIYEKRGSDNDNKEKIKKMSFKEKWSYFREYHLKKTIFIVVLIVAAAYFFNIMVLQKTNDVLKIGVFDDIKVVNSESVDSKFKELLNITNKKDTIKITHLQTQDRRLTDLMGAKEIALVIADEENFYTLAEYYGAFVDLSTVLSEEDYEKVKDKLVMAQSIEFDDNDEEVLGEPKPYGIKIDTKSLMDGDISGDEGTMYLAILEASENMDNNIKAMMYLLK